MNNSNIVVLAGKNNRKAMSNLYELNKINAHYLAKCLLLDDTQAEDATIYAFKNIWETIKNKDLSTEKEFTHYLLRKIVDYSKNVICKTNPKAFKLPNNKDFFIQFDGKLSDENPQEQILSSLPPLQRFIFILHTVGNFSNEQIANFFKFDLKTTILAIDSEKTNINRIAKNFDGNNYYSSLIEKLQSQAEECDMSEKVDEAIYEYIDSIATPCEKKANKKKKIIAIISISIVLALLIIASIVVFVSINVQTEVINNDRGLEEGELIDEPLMEFDSDATYYADIEIQDYGTIIVKLDPEEAPISVSNFITLADSGFYDGLTIHRVLEGYLMQGGDPEGTGAGGSDNCIKGEFSENGVENNHSHLRGTISMARMSGDMDSASSQFFICQEDCTEFDGQYAAFGDVVEGMDIVDFICIYIEASDSNGTVDAENQPIISSISIRTEYENNEETVEETEVVAESETVAA